MAVEVMGNMIRIPQGDTGCIKFAAIKGAVADEDRGVFTLANRSGGILLRKVMAPNGNAFDMTFVYGDTVKLKPDTYEWSFKVARNGTFDDGGRITDVQGQHTAVLKGRLAVMATAGGAR